MSEPNILTVCGLKYVSYDDYVQLRQQLADAQSMNKYLADAKELGLQQLKQAERERDGARAKCEEMWQLLDCVKYRIDLPAPNISGPEGLRKLLEVLPPNPGQHLLDERDALRETAEHFQFQYREFQRLITALLPNRDRTIPPLPRVLFEELSELTKALRERVKVLEQVLRKLEWSDVDPEFGRFCIECDAHQSEPHYPECEVGEALSAAKQEVQS